MEPGQRLPRAAGAVACTASDLAELAAHRELTLPSHFPAPVRVEAARVQAGPEGDLVFLRVRTVDGQPERVTVSPQELSAALLEAD